MLFRSIFVDFGRLRSISVDFSSIFVEKYETILMVFNTLVILAYSVIALTIVKIFVDILQFRVNFADVNFVHTYLSIFNYYYNCDRVYNTSRLGRLLSILI